MQEVRRKLRVWLSDIPDIENYVYRMLPQLGSPTIQKFIKRLRRYIIPQNKKSERSVIYDLSLFRIGVLWHIISKE